jgi:hypothetical protein
LRQAAFAGVTVVGYVVVDFVAVRALAWAERLAFDERIGALTVDEFAALDWERL